MKKIRSLIFRELKICRKWYIIDFLSLLAFSAFVILITFFLTNVFDGLPEDIGKTLTEMFSMLAVLYSTVIFASSNAFKSDLNSGCITVKKTVFVELWETSHKQLDEQIRK